MSLKYTGQPSSEFTGNVAPIQSEDIYDIATPNAIPKNGNPEYPYLTSPKVHQHSNLAPVFADFASRLCGSAGAICGGIGGWQHWPPLAETSTQATDTLLPAIRFVRDELSQCFSWLPMWRTPVLKTTFELGGKYAPRFVPMLRGGLTGCITGTLGGYAVGYLSGVIADWLSDELVGSYNWLTGAERNNFSSEIDNLKQKFLQTSNGNGEFSSMQYWTSQYLSNQSRYDSDASYRDEIDRGYIAIGTAAGEAFLQRGSQVPSNDLAHPQYTLKNTNYDLGSVALGYLLDARAALDDDSKLPNAERNQLAVCSSRIDGQIKKIIQGKHTMLPILQELVNSEYTSTEFDIWRKCVKDSLNREFLVNPQLQNQYLAKCWRDLALIDLCLISTGTKSDSFYDDELHQALQAATELDPENPDLRQLKQLSITLQV